MTSLRLTAIEFVGSTKRFGHAKFSDGACYSFLNVPEKGWMFSHPGEQHKPSFQSPKRAALVEAAKAQ